AASLRAVVPPLARRLQAHSTPADNEKEALRSCGGDDMRLRHASISGFIDCAATLASANAMHKRVTGIVACLNLISSPPQLRNASFSLSAGVECACSRRASGGTTARRDAAAR